MVGSAPGVGTGLHEDGFGVGPDDDVTSADGFAAWVAALEADSDPARTLDVGRHRCTYRWIVEDGRVLGGIALRDGSDDYTDWAGHLGFGIRPSERGKGLAPWAVAEILMLAPVLGMTRVLAVCAVGNAASARTITRSGGVFERVAESKFGPVERYWFTV